MENEVDNRSDFDKAAEKISEATEILRETVA